MALTQSATRQSPATRLRSLAATCAVFAVVLGTAFRVHQLDYGGFSEDEMNKVRAIRAYEDGRFAANAEHPMLMKLTMWGSTTAGVRWNAATPGREWGRMSPEASLRLPNAAVGGLTAVPVFLVARSFFGPAVAGAAALLYAVDVNATGINRIGKEDTFLLFFLLLGVWLYEEARRLHLERWAPPYPWYAASGAAFGLMLASKYMPHYFGLWALFGLAAPAVGRKDRRASAWFYVAFAAAFILANPAILSPATWLYMTGYASGAMQPHHGAFFNGQVYPNSMSTTPWGLPWYFYLQYLGTKIPLVILGVTGIGLVEVWRLRRERGGVFLRVFLVLFLLPSSLVAVKFVRYLLPIFALLDIVAALGLVRAVDWLRRPDGGRLAPVAAWGLAVLVLGSGLAAQVSAAPWPSLFQNSLGAALHAPGSAFPNDEIYDVGMREAVTWVARHAEPGAALASDAPAVVEEYARRAGREDLQSRSLSAHGTAPFPTENWVLVQDSHIYFENEPLIRQVQWRQRPLFTYRVAGAKAVEVYRVE